MLRILLLEDYPPLRRVLAMTLQRAGGYVTLARSACEGLRVPEPDAYDAVLLDMDMAHGESGRALQSLCTAYRPTPIVVLLSPGSVEQHELEVWGARVVLLKPVCREALLGGLRLALQDAQRQP